MTITGNKRVDTSKDTCLGRAMADEWRRMYPQNTAGRIAQDVGITKKAAETLLLEQFSSTSMGKIIAAYGPGWVAERVLEAAGTSLEQYIEKQALAAEREAAVAKAKANEARERLARYRAAVGGRSGDRGPDLGQAE